MFCTRLTIGGGAGKILDENIPEHTLPRHPITGQILPYKKPDGTLNNRCLVIKGSEWTSEQFHPAPVII